MNAVRAKWPKARDITRNFAKGTVKAGDDSALQSLIASMSYMPDGKEEEVDSLLIVDESVSTGKTAAAMIEHLKAAGMLPETPVTLAVCCKMR